MAKMSLFASNPEMMEQAVNYMARHGITGIELLISNNQTVVADALEAAARGVEIIIARGNFSALIRRHTQIPVVDIVLTVQEMGLLINKAKELLNNDRPTIGVVGVKNLFCDMRYFESIFKIQLKTYLVDTTDELLSATDQAVRDGVDIVFGGRRVLDALAETNMPRLFISSTEDSIQEALQVAFNVEYAFDLEKKNSIELSTLLNYSFNSIIKVNAAGEIVALNQAAALLLNVQQAEILGTPFVDLLSERDRHQIEHVLQNGREVFAAITEVNHKAIVYNVAPLILNGKIDGAIISGHEIEKLHQLEADARKQHYLQREQPKFSFDWMEQNLGIAPDELKLGRRFAQSNAPVLIRGGTGYEAEIFAQAIHNASRRKGHPFVFAKCAAYHGPDQLIHLFGTSGSKLGDGVIADAHQGTVFIEEIEALNLQAQYRLLKLITDQISILGRDNRPLPVDVKLIVSTRVNLWDLIERGVFREDLYYALSTLAVTLTPLLEQPDVVEKWLDQYLKQFSETYSRYISLTQSARTALIEYPWQSNVPHLRSFCEKLVLSTPQRSVDENIVQQLLSETYLPRPRKSQVSPIIIYQDPEVLKIKQLLEQYNGNRQDVARAMAISTTTLWRKMKKHNIVWKKQG